MSEREAFKPKCLPISEWPVSHQTRWQAALEKPGLFDEGGGGAHWRPHSVEKTRKGYGVWICWNLHRGVEITNTQPADLVTRDSVLAYVTDLQAINASMTVACRIQELYDAIRVMAPPQSDADNWAWLRQGMENLYKDATPSRNKRGRLQTAQAVEKEGLDLMAQAETAPKRKRGVGLTELQRALMYRDGFMSALLIHRPIRLSNFHALRMNESLVIQESAAAIAFDSDQTKTHRPIEAPFPEALHDALTRYIENYRPVLLTASKKAKGLETDALWISRDGTELAKISLHNAIRRRTQDAFGAPLPPHWFRDASVTTLVRDAPESARLTMGLLGHSSPEIGEKHYNQALHIDSTSKHSADMEKLFNLAAQELDAARDEDE